MTRRRRGRPTSLTPELVAKIARWVAHGAHIDEAARAAGVSRSTLQLWLARGAQSADGLERQLVEAVDEAQGIHAVGCHEVVHRASKRNPKLALEHLKVSHQSRYAASRMELHVTSRLQAALDALKVEFEGEPVLERILACLAGVHGGEGVEGSSLGEGSFAGAGGSPADPSQTDAAAVGVPRPLL